MTTIEFWMQSMDKTDIYIKKWQAENTELIVQIVHGMGEHINRYDELAAFLNENNITVYGSDHRGHGKTGKRQGHLGHMADRHGFEKVTSDLYEVNKIMENEYPNVPVIMLGHSMGSFLARRYIQLHGDKLTGVILSGTRSHPGFPGKIAKLLATLEKKRLKSRAPSKLLNTLIFAPYTQEIEAPETKFDWLTRDKEVVAEYIKDPLCGVTPTASFFLDMFYGLDVIHDKRKMELIPKELPILLISGTEDPVGSKTADVYEVMDSYYQEGIEDITSIFYEGGRHEILNELNRQTVYQDIAKWIEKHDVFGKVKNKYPVTENASTESD